MSDLEDLVAIVKKHEDVIADMEIHAAFTVCAVRAMLKTHHNRAAVRREWDKEMARLWAAHALFTAHLPKNRAAKAQKIQRGFEQAIGLSRPNSS